jgi:hypothetical protein
MFCKIFKIFWHFLKIFKIFGHILKKLSIFSKFVGKFSKYFGHYLEMFGIFGRIFKYFWAFSKMFGHIFKFFKENFKNIVGIFCFQNFWAYFQKCLGICSKIFGHILKNFKIFGHVLKNLSIFSNYFGKFFKIFRAILFLGTFSLLKIFKIFWAHFPNLQKLLAYFKNVGTYFKLFWKF